MSVFITAVGLFLLFEGLLYGAFPSTVKNMAKLVEDTPESTIQIGGIAVALIGLLIVWLSHG
ncbi:MAG: DUF2065 domain-containing protein [Ahrensia sp.]|nr:DUF2065 domain-containing protein [Ahrensia sp.]